MTHHTKSFVNRPRGLVLINAHPRLFMFVAPPTFFFCKRGASFHAGLSNKGSSGRDNPAMKIDCNGGRIASLLTGLAGGMCSHHVSTLFTPCPHHAQVYGLAAQSLTLDQLLPTLGFQQSTGKPMHVYVMGFHDLKSLQVMLMPCSTVSAHNTLMDSSSSRKILLAIFTMYAVTGAWHFPCSYSATPLPHPSLQTCYSTLFPAVVWS